LPAIAVALLCLLVWLLPPDWVADLIYRRSAIEAGEWWRLWTAHLTHYSWGHLLVDGGTIAGLGWLLQRRMSPWLLGVALVVAMPLISAVLYIGSPLISEYRGSSAIAAMLWVLVAVQLLKELPWVGGGLLLLLAARIGGDALGISDLFTSLPPGVFVAWQAHLAGAVAGMIVASLAFIFPYKLKKRS